MTDAQAELRKCWRRYHTEQAARSAEWAARYYQHPPPESVPYPDGLHDLRCGARTRAGTPCKRRDLYISGRCKLHGGLSTGPKRIKPEPTP